jgi:hypothetical protein
VNTKRLPSGLHSPQHAPAFGFQFERRGWRFPCQSSKKGGTGLGLAISKQLANHLGGKLELVKTDKEGTIFRLTIPGGVFVGANSKKGALEPANALA